jgi:hypothetical protein
LLWPAAAVAEEAPQPDNPPPSAPKLDLQDKHVEDRAPIRSMKENRDEFLAYCDAVMTARFTPAAAFARSARRDLTFAHLFEQPKRYRGEVAHVEGRMRRVRHLEADSFLWSQGVHDLYEGWIFDFNLYGAQPVCVLFTDLPPGMNVGEQTDFPVVFDGYFFKRYRYEGADKRWHDTALLIGRQPILVADVAPSSRGALSATFRWTVVAIVAGIIGLIAGLGWWYRQGDRRVRAQVSASRWAIMPATDFAADAPAAAEETARQT